MSKMSTDLARQALNGPTMGTRWSALFFAPPGINPAAVQGALQGAVDAVDNQMSTWKPDSDLMRLNAAEMNIWVEIPAELACVLTLGLTVGRASGGAFDIGMGDAVTAWGFGAAPADPAAISAALTAARAPAHTVLDVDLPACRVRKRAPITIDLNGIAKGYGVDRLAETLQQFGIANALVGIDGEMRAFGLRPDGQPWTVAVEAPDPDRRTPHSVLELHDAAVATSGDYRHWVTVQDRRLSHSMDPQRGRPLLTSPASVTVITRSCAEADAWATALMVAGAAGALTSGAMTSGALNLARAHGLDALILTRAPDGTVTATAQGGLFSGGEP